MWNRLHVLASRQSIAQIASQTECHWRVDHIRNGGHAAELRYHSLQVERGGAAPFRLPYSAWAQLINQIAPLITQLASQLPPYLCQQISRRLDMYLLSADTHTLCNRLVAGSNSLDLLFVFFSLSYSIAGDRCLDLCIYTRM